MEIQDRIMQTIHDFVISTGKLPKFIYLGLEELRDFEVHISNYHTFHMSDGPEFFGIKVCRVEMKNHLEVA